MDEKKAAPAAGIEKPADLKQLIPEEKDPLAQENSLVNFKKTKQYYDDLDLNMNDLEIAEKRVEELEQYLGIEGIHQVDYFVKNDIEKLDQKCMRLNDFITVIEN